MVRIILETTLNLTMVPCRAVCRACPPEQAWQGASGLRTCMVRLSLTWGVTVLCARSHVPVSRSVVKRGVFLYESNANVHRGCNVCAHVFILSLVCVRDLCQFNWWYVWCGCLAGMRGRTACVRMYVPYEYPPRNCLIWTSTDLCGCPADVKTGYGDIDWCPYGPRLDRSSCVK